MLDSVLEFFTQAASSSAFIFCFCNLIIVIILVDLKPSLSIHQESEIPLSKGANQNVGANYKEIDTTSLPQAEEVSHDQKAEVVESIEIEGNDDCSNEEEEEKVEEEKEEDHDDDDDNHDDDELRRRVEEFIKKVNKGWKEELLSTSSLV